MDIIEIRKMNKDEIAKELKSKQAALQDMRFKVSMEEHSQVRDFRKLKKEVAQLLTVLKEKDLGINEKSKVKEIDENKTKKDNPKD